MSTQWAFANNIPADWFSEGKRIVVRDAEPRSRWGDVTGSVCKVLMPGDTISPEDVQKYALPKHLENKVREESDFPVVIILQDSPKNPELPYAMFPLTGKFSVDLAP